MKNRQWIWGIFLILAAGLLVATQMGWALTFSPFTIVATIFLAGMLVQNLIHRSIGGTVFSIAFLLMLYNGPLGISNLVPWTILWAAVLLTAGLSIIIRPKNNYWHARRQTWMRHHRNHSNWEMHGEFDGDFAENDVQTNDDSIVNIDTAMGNSIRYVQSDDLKQVNIATRMGATKVYFDKSQILDQAIVNVDCSLGGVSLYIPRSWNVVIDVSSVMAGVEERGLDSTKEGPTLRVRGSLLLGGMTIYYI